MGKCLSTLRDALRARLPSGSSGGGTNIPLTPGKPPQPPVPPETPGELPKPPTDVTPPDGGTIEDSVLTVQSVDFCVAENAAGHHTSKYELVRRESPILVIRRGIPFRMKITFNRTYSPGKDSICLVLTAKDAPMPSYAQGTMVFIPVLADADLPSDGWQCKLLSSEGKNVTLNVTSLPNAIVGEWSVDIDTKLQKSTEEESVSVRHAAKSPVYLLFNPWCEKDTVYLNNSDWRDEYVLNDSGLLWRGSSTRLRPTSWNYGQFEESVLECCCYLLSHVGKLSAVARADPARVVRHISAVINSPDDSGVVVGNWSGDYAGGQAPTHWGGSPAILQQFYKTKKPVKFGQCWVFSGVYTSVCRALGIPTRSVTNFASAHDTHNSLTIDYFYDEEGDEVKDLNIDSVWNFHVWNEAWMERPDLEPGNYGGWQAVDSTPQEESDGMFRCGPCSVKAIKRGEVMKAFDSPFIFAEVNADKVYWRYRGDKQPLKLIKKSTDEIGLFISTKAVGSFQREDITHEYKHRERTKEEREVMFRALRQCPNAFSRYYLNDNFEDVQFDFKLLDDIVIGAPFSMKLVAMNKSREGKQYTVSATLRVVTVLYTGQPKHMVKTQKFEERTLSPGSEEEMALTVSFSDYERALVEQGAFNILAVAKVLETDFDYFALDDFRVRMPDIKIETEGDFVQGQEFTVHAHFKNPLPKTLKKGVFFIEGPGLGQPLKLPVKGDVRPDEEARVTCTLTPKTDGEKTIIAKFQSRELDDVDGHKVIYVRPLIENDKPVDGHN